MAMLKEQIFKIGRQMVDCKINCPDAKGGNQLDKKRGFLPQTLILENASGGGEGVVIAGLNPGHASESQRKFYRINGPSYEQELSFWEEKSRGRPYFRQLRGLARQLGYDGPILWTNLAKCECKPKVKLGLQTLRTCRVLYLKNELELIPENWPFVAAGQEAFKALAYLYPNRPVIGVPHPTGAAPNFRRLFDGQEPEKILREVFRPKPRDLRDGERGRAIWLPNLAKGRSA